MEALQAEFHDADQQMDIGLMQIFVGKFDNYTSYPAWSLKGTAAGFAIGVCRFVFRFLGLPGFRVS